VSQSYQLTAYEEDSSCFHHNNKKGCHVVWYPVPKKGDDGKQLTDEEGKKLWVKMVMCKTHKARICYALDEDEPKRCFWEVGGHNNELSKGYDAPYSLDTYPLDESNENPIESLI
jgi:hypothetical protein